MIENKNITTSSELIFGEPDQNMNTMVWYGVDTIKMVLLDMYCW